MSKALEVLNAIDQLYETGSIDRNVLFRGQAVSTWPLIPKAGRSEYNVVNAAGVHLNDINRFTLQWIRDSRKTSQLGVDQSEWDVYAEAQHHGLATRLLDWSWNPMVALFFACCDEIEKNGIVFAWKPSQFPLVCSDEPISDQNEIGIFEPNQINSRIIAQGGLFSFHPQKDAPFSPESNTLKSVEILASDKIHILLSLRKYRISYEHLFPDLDGLAKDMNLVTRNAVNIVAGK